MTEQTNIHQRIGEAITSKGEFNIIRAENAIEEQILIDAGFVKVGSMKEGGKIVALFKVELKEKEVVKIVEVPKTTQYPWNTHKEVPGQPGIWYLNQNSIPKPYQMYTYGTSTGDAEWAYKNFDTTTSQVNTNSYNKVLNRGKVDITNTQLLQEINDTLKVSLTDKVNHLINNSPRNI